MHRPIVPLGHVLRSAAGRLRPPAVRHFTSRRMCADSALKNATEQDSSIPAPGGFISGQPAEDVRNAVTAGGFQAAVFFRKPDLALTGTASTWASTAMLTDRDHAGRVRHRNTRIEDGSRLAWVPRARNIPLRPRRIISPGLRILFSKFSNDGAQNPRLQRAPRANARTDFAHTPPEGF